MPTNTTAVPYAYPATTTRRQVHISSPSAPIRGESLFGEVVDGDVVLSENGRVAHEEWQASEHIRQEIELDAFVIMPNHLHGIVWIRESVGAHGL